MTDLRREPWTYPGRPLRAPVLLGVPGPDGAPAPLHGPVGTALVGTADGDHPLDRVLADRGLAPPAARRPVAAYGSNADPRVLARKLRDGGAPAVVPLRPARIGGLRPATSAHVGAPGFLPAAAAAAERAALAVAVAWLDAAQLRCLHATEPNYRPVTLDPARHAVIAADTGEEVAGVLVYDTRWGVLPGEGPPGAQDALWRRVLREHPAVAALLGADGATGVRLLMLALGADPALRTAVREVLAGAAEPTGLVAVEEGSPNLAG